MRAVGLLIRGYIGEGVRTVQDCMCAYPYGRKERVPTPAAGMRHFVPYVPYIFHIQRFRLQRYYFLPTYAREDALCN